MRIEYEPRSVRDLLVEMKDCSELMIDLAYSAVLFNDEKLAREVLKLEEKVDRLRDLLNMSIMLATRDAEDAEMSIGIANVATAADKISDAAADIAHLVLRKLPLHESVLKAVKEAEEGVERIEIPRESALAKKNVGEVHSIVGIDIIAIQTTGKWTIDPDEDVALQPECVLIVRGSEAGIKKLRELAKSRHRRR